MSSDGSVSTTGSRIRQFGLYRTIDARTEEFLRLSRKRQLKQGCACAAVSTVVTVIIVISIILVYEYSTISETGRKILSKPSWLGLMNASTDTVFDPKLNKAKINLDAASIQLLPLLLRTLKKSGFYDKITEDSSPSSSSERKDATEPYEKNVFSDTRNWMRMPISRLYAIEYKTSPIVYFKNPTRKNDYFTKIRKIRDYQRMLNYVDKMISDKVTFGSTQPMLKAGLNVYINKDTYTTPMTKTMNHANRLHGETNEQSHEREKIKKPNCVCPQKIGQLLTKLIASLQNLLPDFTNNKTEYITPCVSNAIVKQEDVLSGPSKKTPEKIVKANSNTTLKHVDSKSTNIISTPTTVQPLKYMKSVSSMYPSLSKIMNLLRPKTKNPYWDEEAGINSSENANKKDNLQNINKIDANSVVPLTSTGGYVKSEGDYIYIKRKYKKTPKDVQRSTLPIFSDDDYDDDLDTTPNVIQNFNFLDAHSLELVKRKYLSPRLQNVELKDKNESLKSTKQNHSSFEVKTNSSKMISQEKPANLEPNPLHNKYFDDINKINITSTTIKMSTKKYFEKTTHDSLKTEHDKLEESADAKIVDKYLSYYKQDQQTDDVTLEEEFEKASTENPEDSLRNLELIIKSLNISENTQNDLNTNKSNSLNFELITNSKHSTKSMIPRNRPSYLEMQRSELKREEVQDYDNTNNYLFE